MNNRQESYKSVTEFQHYSAAEALRLITEGVFDPYLQTKPVLADIFLCVQKQEEEDDKSFELLTVDIINELVRRGVNLNYSDHNGNALSEAARKCNLHAVRRLVSLGVSALIRDIQGQHPLHLAVKWSFREPKREKLAEIFALLITAGGNDPHYVDYRENKSVYDELFEPTKSAYDACADTALKVVMESANEQRKAAIAAYPEWEPYWENLEYLRRLYHAILHNKLDEIIELLTAGHRLDFTDLRHAITANTDPAVFSILETHQGISAGVTSGWLKCFSYMKGNSKVDISYISKKEEVHAEPTPGVGTLMYYALIYRSVLVTRRLIELGVTERPLEDVHFINEGSYNWVPCIERSANVGALDNNMQEYKYDIGRLTRCEEGSAQDSLCKILELYLAHSDPAIVSDKMKSFKPNWQTFFSWLAINNRSDIFNSPAFIAAAQLLPWFMENAIKIAAAFGSAEFILRAMETIDIDYVVIAMTMAVIVHDDQLLKRLINGLESQGRTLTEFTSPEKQEALRQKFGRALINPLRKALFCANHQAIAILQEHKVFIEHDAKAKSQDVSVVQVGLYRENGSPKGDTAIQYPSLGLTKSK